MSSSGFPLQLRWACTPRSGTGPKVWITGWDENGQSSRHLQRHHESEGSTDFRWGHQRGASLSRLRSKSRLESRSAASRQRAASNARRSAPSARDASTESVSISMRSVRSQAARAAFIAGPSNSPRARRSANTISASVPLMTWSSADLPGSAQAPAKSASAIAAPCQRCWAFAKMAKPGLRPRKAGGAEPQRRRRAATRNIRRPMVRKGGLEPPRA